MHISRNFLPLLSSLEEIDCAHDRRAENQKRTVLILRNLFVCVLCAVLFVVSFTAFCHNSATNRSYGKLYIWACCSEQGESNSDVFRTSVRVLQGEKHKCQQNWQNISYNPWGLKIRDIRVSSRPVFAGND